MLEAEVSRDVIAIFQPLFFIAGNPLAPPGKHGFHVQDSIELCRVAVTVRSNLGVAVFAKISLRIISRVEVTTLRAECSPVIPALNSFRGDTSL